MNPIIRTHTEKNRCTAEEREQKDTMSQETNRNNSLEAVMELEGVGGCGSWLIVRQ